MARGEPQNDVESGRGRSADPLLIKNPDLQMLKLVFIGLNIIKHS